MCKLASLQLELINKTHEILRQCVYLLMYHKEFEAAYHKTHITTTDGNLGKGKSGKPWWQEFTVQSLQCLDTWQEVSHWTLSFPKDKTSIKADTEITELNWKSRNKPYLHGQWIFDKSTNTVQQGKNKIFNKRCQGKWVTHKRMKGNLFITSVTPDSKQA